MWGFHRCREWGQGGFFSFFCFCFEGELLLSEETERNFVSCSNTDHSQKWQATAQWRQGQILNGCIHSRGGKQGNEFKNFLFFFPRKRER